jgi:hypothetical protein
MVGMECEANDCLESLEFAGVEAIVADLVAEARQEGWSVSRDMMTTFTSEADPHPTARIVAEGPITPGPGSEALQDAVKRALGTVTD